MHADRSLTYTYVALLFVDVIFIIKGVFVSVVTKNFYDLYDCVQCTCSVKINMEKYTQLIYENSCLNIMWSCIYSLSADNSTNKL